MNLMYAEGLAPCIWEGIEKWRVRHDVYVYIMGGYERYIEKKVEGGLVTSQ